jgi:pseudaminic acid synthase
MKTTSIIIDGKIINSESPTYIIAELSANHVNDIEIVYKSIEEISKCGVDAVKLQTYTADTLTINSCGKHFVKEDGLWKGKSLYELYKEASMPWEWQPKLKKFAEELGITLFSSPFDKSSVDFLENMDVPAYKIASFEITDIPLIEYTASKGKPIIISTGIATLADIEEAIAACKFVGNEQIILLKCTSAYPAQLEEANLRTIQNIADTFGVLAGFSDHTIGITAPVVAVSMGAKIIEKHFILDKSLGGPDAAFSLDIHGFREMVQAVRDTEKLLGTITYEMTENKNKSRASRRSLFVVENIKQGEIITEYNVRSIRPGYGLHPKYFKDILGKKAIANLKQGTALDWSMFK